MNVKIFLKSPFMDACKLMLYLVFCMSLKNCTTITNKRHDSATYIKIKMEVSNYVSISWTQSQVPAFFHAILFLSSSRKVVNFIFKVFGKTP